MQAPVSDAYAVALAKSFYAHLAARENFLASRALANARKDAEQQRLDAVRRGAPAAETQPEYATAALYIAGEERSIADFGLELRPLQTRPVLDVAGPVPQLRIDDLIGRRPELRETLRSLRDPSRQYAGVVLTGIGGVGKSAVAGRVMCRLTEDRWLVAAPDPGRFDLRAIAFALGAVILDCSSSESARKRGEDLVRPDLDDRLRLHAVAKTLAENRVLLVLDDFEQNLTLGGEAFLDPDAADILRQLANSARAGRLLITCRYPIPGGDAWLRRVPIGPLSPAETRKLRLRLPALAASDIGDNVLLRLIGGHPRMLEFLDALLRGGQGRMPAVTEKLRRLAEDHNIKLTATLSDMTSAMPAALLIGARDVLLGELLSIVRAAGIEEVLLQAAVSNLPVAPQGLARMLADDGPGDVSSVEAAAARLEALSLLHRFPNHMLLVHRWTAQGLAELSDAATHQARSVRAGRYRMWRAEHQTRAIEDGVEALRNFLEGRDFDAAVSAAQGLFEAMRRFRQSVAIAGLAAELLETLPENHGSYAVIADEEAQAHLALGLSGRALSRYQQLLRRQENLARAEPDRADYQRDLSVSYNRMGDLFSALGQGDEARAAFLKSLAIRERLAQAEPDRADYQRDIIVSCVKISENVPTEARAHLSRALDIARRLQSQGRMNPADAWMIEDLTRRLGDLSG
jgi:tetratricopeptide (TPR) repeat protein